MLPQLIKDYIRDHEAEAYDLLLTLARIPAPSGREEKRAEFCYQWLKEQGAEDVYIDEALNVVFPIHTKENGPVKVYMAHTDVVFADETPLPLRVEGGRIYCPGVGDDTACLVCLLMVAKYIAGHGGDALVKELKGDSAPGLVLVCNSCEEGLGNLKGVKQICQAYKDRIASFCTFDSELDYIVDRAVGSKRFEVTVRTKGGHSFGDFGNDNAIERLAYIIEKLYQIQVPDKGKTTYNVGLVSGGTSVNTIAQEASMLYEFRSDLRENLEYMDKKFSEILCQERERGLDVSSKVIGLRPCEGEVDQTERSRLLEKAVRTVTEITGRTPVLKAGSTDCNIPLSMGIPSVCVGSYRGGGAHTREEYVEISSLAEGYRIAFEMILGR